MKIIKTIGKIFVWSFIILVAYGVYSAMSTNSKTSTASAPTTKDIEQKESKIIDSIKREELLAEVVKMSPSGGKSHTEVHIRMTNNSSYYLKHWAVKIEVYNDKDEYLGQGECMVSDERSGDSKIETTSIIDVSYDSIKKYRLILNGVVDEKTGYRIDKNFVLIQK
jgi:hypothetical protein